MTGMIYRFIMYLGLSRAPLYFRPGLYSINGIHPTRSLKMRTKRFT